MRAKVQLVSLVALTLAGLMSLAACGGSSGPPPPPPTPTPSSNGLTIYPSIASVPVGGTADFTGYVPSNSSATITWAVSGSSNGSITSAGVYTAPTSVPSPAQVAITATSGNFSATAVVTVTAAQGIAVNPAAASVLAGTVTQFTATSMGAIAAGVTWEVNGSPGGDPVHGTIDVNGNYTAPPTPPPGGSTVVTATLGGNAGTSTVTVVYSNASLNGAYAYSYAGDDSTGFLAVAGNFTADPGTGTLTGVEDVLDLGNLLPGQVITGSYSIGPDGRGSVSLNAGAEIWQIALSSNQHAVMINFGTVGTTGTATGSGTIDQQTTATPVLAAGHYVFQFSGLDSNSTGPGPLSIAGEFTSLGNGGLTTSGNVVDVNDAGSAGSSSSTVDDTTLTGSFSLPVGPTSGILTLTSTDLGDIQGTSGTTLTFDFYVVSPAHIRVIETDGNAFLSGDVYGAPTPGGAGYTAALLQTGNYPFTLGGATGNGPYAAGGVLISNGGGTSPTGTAGSITGGVFDNNNGGDGLQSQSDATIKSGSYGVDSTTGRITLSSIGTNQTSGTFNLVAYVTATDPANPNSPAPVLLLEIDANVIASGPAYLQSGVATPAGDFALNLTGVATSSGTEQDILGQLGVAGTTVTGTIDINNFEVNGQQLGLNVVSSSTIVSTDSNGRGTATFTAANGASFPVAYYVVDQNTVVMIETDTARVMTGLLMKQY